MTANLNVILGIEAICAAQGIEQRAPLATSEPLQAAMACLRSAVPTLQQDRYLAPDLRAAADCISNDSLAAACGLGLSL
jgi:histidine ammonia-lyase